MQFQLGYSGSTHNTQCGGKAFANFYKFVFPQICSDACNPMESDILHEPPSVVTVMLVDMQLFTTTLACPSQRHNIIRSVRS